MFRLLLTNVYPFVSVSAEPSLPLVSFPRIGSVISPTASGAASGADIVELFIGTPT
jgi:hypothetical protein